MARCWHAAFRRRQMHTYFIYVPVDRLACCTGTCGVPEAACTHCPFCAPCTRLAQDNAKKASIRKWLCTLAGSYCIYLQNGQQQDLRWKPRSPHRGACRQRPGNFYASFQGGSGAPCTKLCDVTLCLPVCAQERDLRDEFERYGRLRSVWVARKPPGFGEDWLDITCMSPCAS